MLERLFARIGSELGVTVTRYSFGKFQHHEYRLGDLTYDYDSSFQVKVCNWPNTVNHRCEHLESPTPIVTREDETRFEGPLREAVKKSLHDESS